MKHRIEVKRILNEDSREIHYEYINNENLSETTFNELVNNFSNLFQCFWELARIKNLLVNIHFPNDIKNNAFIDKQYQIAHKMINDIWNFIEDEFGITLY